VSAAASPTVRRRRLAAELRRLRERQHLTGDEVAVQIGWSTSKLSRYELARGGLKPAEVRRLLDFYGVDEARQEQLLALAREAASKGWWDDYADSFSPEFIALIGMEAEAAEEWAWHLDVVPGLLQSESYARATVDQVPKVEPTLPSKLDRAVLVRRRRQELLDRDPPLGYSVVIDEAILRREVGSPAVMREQLAHLVRMAERPNVSLQVTPLIGRDRIVMNSFDLLRFGADGDGTRMPDVVWNELLTVTMYFEGEEDTFRYQALFQKLQEEALTSQDSVELIRQTAREVWS
jgi:transcriptional regulator with XRE-family HTH domain